MSEKERVRKMVLVKVLVKVLGINKLLMAGRIAAVLPRKEIKRKIIKIKVFKDKVIYEL